MSFSGDDFKKMEESGVFDYYNTLSSWMGRFIEMNHPLTNEDFLSLMNDLETDNSKTRKLVSEVMRNKLLEILEREAKLNQERLKTFTENLDIAFFLAESPEQKLIRFQDEILEARYNALFPEEDEEKQY